MSGKKNRAFVPSAHEISETLYPHVYNEIDQLVQMLTRATEDRAWANARIESIAVHARCMVDFFHGGERKDVDDVLATDYSFLETFKCAKIRERANKDINHLTYARVRNYPERSQWRPQELADLLCISRRFVMHISSCGMAEQHSQLWASLENRLQRLITDLAEKNLIQPDLPHAG